MNISELVDKLQEVQKNYGDIQVEDDSGLELSIEIYEDEGTDPVLVIS